jgi:glyoxylate reductase
MSEKPRIYITTNVFNEIATNQRVSQKVRDEIVNAWETLQSIANVDVFDGRFPDADVLEQEITDPRTRFVGCHLSHKIEQSWLDNSNVVAVCTATMGFDHVGQVPGVLITHTPGVLNNAVGDYTVALLETALRNTNGLHDYVWSGRWEAGEKWDLDGNLSRSLDGQVLGIVGLGEIGTELARRTKPWGVKILYYDIMRREDLEATYDMEFREDMASVFQEADIVSLHIPLNPQTAGCINRDLLSLMKDNALLVNTARGGILNAGDLLDLLEEGKAINFASDVFDPEPIAADQLERFRAVKEKYPERRFVLMPHNASADANTRGTMARMLFEDLYWLTTSKGVDDLASCRIIALQKKAIAESGIEQFRISQYWEE